MGQNPPEAISMSREEVPMMVRGLCDGGGLVWGRFSRVEADLVVYFILGFRATVAGWLDGL